MIQLVPKQINASIDSKFGKSCHSKLHHPSVILRPADEIEQTNHDYLSLLPSIQIILFLSHDMEKRRDIYLTVLVRASNHQYNTPLYHVVLNALNKIHV